MENLIEKYYKQEIKKIIDKSSEILEEEQYRRVIEYLIGYLSSQLEPPVGMPEPNPSFGQWVEAEYKLPDDGEEVIFINTGKHIRIGEYSDDEFMQGYWVNKCEQYLTKDIKRWMPLPKL